MKKSIFQTGLVMLMCIFLTSFTPKEKDVTYLYTYAYAHLDDGKTWMFTPVFTVTVNRSTSCSIEYIPIQKQFYDYLKNNGYSLAVNAVTQVCNTTSRNEVESQKNSLMEDFKTRGYSVRVMSYFSYKHP